MTVHERITEILRQARVAGGWIDEDVATAVLKELGHYGKPVILQDGDGGEAIAKGATLT